MKIFDEHQKQIGELNKPEPVLQDGQWWEAEECRFANEDEHFFGFDGHVWLANGNRLQEFWIMREIPTPTAEQLKAIGKVTGDRPVECKEWDEVWCEMTNGWKGLQVVMKSHINTIGKFRWVLENAPGEKEAAGTCPVCGDPVYHRSGHPGEFNHDCKPPAEDKGAHICTGCTTPAIICPNANEPKDKVKECANKNIKMPALAQRAGEERYSIEEIEKYLRMFPYFTAKDALHDIDDPQNGIKAVTQRKESK